MPRPLSGPTGTAFPPAANPSIRFLSPPSRTEAAFSAPGMQPDDTLHRPEYVAGPSRIQNTASINTVDPATDLSPPMTPEPYRSAAPFSNARLEDERDGLPTALGQQQRALHSNRPGKDSRLQTRARTVSSPYPVTPPRPVLAHLPASDPKPEPKSGKQRRRNGRALSPATNNANPFEPYGTLPSRADTNEEIIKYLLGFSKRVKEAHKPGRLYLLKHADPSLSDFIKIGYTSRNAQLRANEQRTSCGKDFIIISDGGTKFACAKAVDHVLKIALRHRRYRLRCDSCATSPYRRKVSTPGEAVGLLDQIATEPLEDAQKREHEEWYSDNEEVRNAVEQWRTWVEQARPFNGWTKWYWNWELSRALRQPDDVVWERFLQPPTRWKYFRVLMGAILFSVLWCPQQTLIMVEAFAKASRQVGRPAKSRLDPWIRDLFLWIGVFLFLALVWHWFGWWSVIGCLWGHLLYSILPIWLLSQIFF